MHADTHSNTFMYVPPKPTSTHLQAPLQSTHPHILTYVYTQIPAHTYSDTLTHNHANTHERTPTVGNFGLMSRRTTEPSDL